MSVKQEAELLEESLLKIGAEFLNERRQRHIPEDTIMRLTDEASGEDFYKSGFDRMLDAVNAEKIREISEYP